MRGLERFAVGAVPEEEVAFEGGVTYQDGEVLAFDQSITATGWVHVSCRRGEAEVVKVGSIKCPPDGYPKGHEGTLLRAEYVGTQMAAILRSVAALTVVHEMPPVATTKMSRPESSLLTALALRIEARRQGHDVVVVSNQHSKKLLVGNGNATKPQWHKALDRLPWTHTGYRPTNEGQRDAMCLALTYLIEKESE